MSSLARVFFPLLAAALTMGMMGCTTQNPVSDKGGSHICLSWDQKEIVVELYHNNAADDLLSKLPTTVSFNDYRERQKTAVLVLDTGDAPGECDCVTGDMTYYAPWGQITFFYKDFGHAPDLTPLGKIESGLEFLQEIDSGTEVTIKVMESEETYEKQ